MVTRNSEATQRAILAAANREFVNKGYSGARVDAIASAAAVNKRMLYHYFNNKRGLYAAVVAQALGTGTQASADSGVAADLWGMARRTRLPAGHARLLGWEGLDAAAAAVSNDPPSADLDLHQQPIVVQEADQISANFDPAMVELLLTAFQAFPQICAPAARRIVGTAVDSPAFADAQERFLEQLLPLLQRRVTSQSTAGKAKVVLRAQTRPVDSNG